MHAHTWKNAYLPSKLTKFYAFYGITSHHSLHFHFSNSSLAGSYFLGQCKVDDSVLYKSDIRETNSKPKAPIMPFKTTI